MIHRREQKVNILVTEGGVHAFPVSGYAPARRALQSKYELHGLQIPTARTSAGKGVTAGFVLPQAVLNSVELRSLAPEKPLSEAAAGPIKPVYYPHEGGIDYIGGNFTD